MNAEQVSERIWQAVEDSFALFCSVIVLLGVAAVGALAAVGLVFDHAPLIGWLLLAVVTFYWMRWTVLRLLDAVDDE